MSNATSVKCEKCGANLKLPASITPGKKIRCPKCSEIITVPAPAQTSPPKPKDDPKPAKEEPSKKPMDDDEEDSGGHYGLREQSAPTPQDKKEKPKVDYALDNSVKDLRGPAQAAVLGPSNKIIMRSIFCVALAFASFGIGVWPFLFQEDILDYRDTLKAYFKEAIANAKGDEAKKLADRAKTIDNDNKNDILRKNVYPELYKEKKNDLSAETGINLEEPEREFIKEIRKKHIPYRIAWIICSLIILGYNLFIAMAAVKMQAMESYNWSIACAVMSIIPINCIGLIVKIWSADVKPDPMQLFPEEGFDLLQLFTHPLFLLCLEYVGSLAMGAMALTILLKEEVKEGFAYKGDLD